ncbi:MAG: hypothetical protein HQ517_13795 [SAR324 cluster bacterium]|nr:hypothetical protein [SAR324 cluster bacterium]
MAIDEKIRSILTEKCHFTGDHITKLENNTGLRTRMTSLFKMVQRSPNQPSVQKFVQVQLRKIRQDLDTPSANKNPLLQARAEYYTFKHASHRQN